MTIAELLEELERRAREAEAINATASVAAVLRSVSEQICHRRHQICRITPTRVRVENKSEHPVTLVTVTTKGTVIR